MVPKMSKLCKINWPRLTRAELTRLGLTKTCACDPKYGKQKQTVLLRTAADCLADSCGLLFCMQIMLGNANSTLLWSTAADCCGLAPVRPSIEKHKQKVHLRTDTPFSIYNNKREGWGGESARESAASHVGPQRDWQPTQKQNPQQTLYRGPAIQTGSAAECPAI